MDIIVSGWQTHRIWVLLEYSFNHCLQIQLRLGPESQKSLVNSFTHYIGQRDPALPKYPRLTETLRI
jgi:hypothetical protein